MSHCVSVGVSALPAPTPFSCSYLIKSSLRQWRDPPSRESESTLYGSTRNTSEYSSECSYSCEYFFMEVTVSITALENLIREEFLRDRKPMFEVVGPWDHVFL